MRAPDYTPARRFNCLTRYYDAVFEGTTRVRIFKQVPIRQADIKAEHSALELASGTGMLAVWAKRSRPLVTGARIDGDAAIVSLPSCQ